MAKFVDTVQATIVIDNNQAINKLGQLEMAHADVRKEMKSLAKEVNEYEKAVKNASKYEIGAKKFEEASKKAANLTNYVDRYTKLLKNAELNAQGLEKGTAAYDKAQQKIDVLTNKIKSFQVAARAAAQEANKNRFAADKFSEANQEVQKLKNSVDKFNEAAKQTHEAAKAVEAYRSNLKATEMTMRQLRKEQQDVNKQLDNQVRGSAKYNELKTRLQEINTVIKAQKDDLNGAATGWKKFTGSFASFGAMAAGVIGGEIILQAFQWIVSFVGSIATGAAKVSDELADIQKSTGATLEEVKAMNNELSKINTRSSTSELRQIAKVAGQLGIAKEEIVGFTEQVDKMNVALGDEFSGGAEEITRSMGTLQTLFTDTKNLKADDAMNRIGSAVNALGAAGKARAPEVADFTKRIGALGKLAPTIQETMGLAAALTGELGLSSEQAAGGVTAIMLEAGNRTKEFAKQIGITEKELKSLLNTDPNEMFLRLAQSMQGLDNDQVITALKNMGIGSQEAIKVMQQLASNTDIVTEKQRLAAKEFEKGTSLTDEFNIKNNNFAASLDKAGKAWNGLVMGMGASLQPILQVALDLFTQLFSKTGKAPEYMQPLIDVFKRVKQSFSIVWNAIVDTLKAFGLLEGKSKALDVVIKILAVTIEVLAFQFTVIASALQRARKDFVEFYNSSETFRRIVTGAIEAVKTVFANFFSTVSTGFEALSDLLTALINGDLSKFESALQKSWLVLKELAYGNAVKIGESFAKGYQKGAEKIKIKTQVEIDKDKADAELKKQQEEQEKLYAQQEELLKKVEGLKFVDAAAKQKIIDELGYYAQSTKEQREEIAKAANELIAKNNQTLFGKNLKDSAKKVNQEAEKLLEGWKNYQEKIRQLQADEALNALSGENREVEETKRKYEALIAEAKTFKRSKEEIDTEVRKLEELHLNELTAIQKKYADERENEKEEKEKARNEIKTQVDEATLDDFSLEILQTENKYNELIRLAQAYNSQLLENEEEHKLNITALEQAKADAIDAIFQNQKDKELAAEQAKFQAKLQLASEFTNLMTATLNLFGKQSAEQIAFQKAITLAQIAIDTAAAIASVTAKNATTSVTPIDYAIKVAASIGTVLANMAKAKQVLSKANTPEQPKFAKGGGIDITGNSHATGGIDLLNKAGQKVGEMEGGESYLLLSKQTTKNNRPLLEALLQSSQTNGAAVLPDFGAMQRAIQSTNTTINHNTTTNNGFSDELLMQLLYEQRAIREAFAQMPKELKAHVVYSDFQEADTKVKNLATYQGQ